MSKTKNGLLFKAGALVLIAALCVAAIAGVSGCKKAYSESEFIDVSICTWTGTCEAALYVAEEQGFFEEQGINATFVNVAGVGTAATLEEAESTGAYVIFNATPNFLPAMSSGSTDVKYLCEVHTGCIQAAVPAGSSIKSVADLEGKRVGTYTGVDMSAIYLNGAMAAVGADYSTVTYVNCGTFANALKMVQNGELDALSWFDPNCEVLIKALGWTEIFDNATDEAYADQTCCFLAANANVYNDADVAKRCAQAVADAAEWCQNNKAEAAAIIQGDNESGTAYVFSGDQMMTAYGYDTATSGDYDLHAALMESYTFGDGGADHFAASLKSQWETVILTNPAALPEGKSVDDMVALCGSYAL